eukprot:scaffold625_cov324-Pavlova_lutheri.AAC.31
MLLLYLFCLPSSTCSQHPFPSKWPRHLRWCERWRRFAFERLAGADAPRRPGRCVAASDHRAWCRWTQWHRKAGKSHVLRRRAPSTADADAWRGAFPRASGILRVHRRGRAPPLHSVHMSGIANAKDGPGHVRIDPHGCRTRADTPLCPWPPSYVVLRSSVRSLSTQV